MRLILCVFAAVILVIGLTGISGCVEENELNNSINNVTAPLQNHGNSSNTKQTPTPAKTPTVKTSFDPLLAKLVPTLKAEYGNNMVDQRAKGTNINFDAIYVTSEKNGKVTIAEIRNEGSIAAASNFFKTSPCISSDIKTPGSVTHLGQQAATVALGHAPTTVNDVYCKGTGDYLGVDNEYIQYDQLIVITTVTSEK